MANKIGLGSKNQDFFYFLFYRCPFLSLYLRGKEKEKDQKKEKARHRFLQPYGCLF